MAITRWLPITIALLAVPLFLSAQDTVTFTNSDSAAGSGSIRVISVVPMPPEGAGPFVPPRNCKAWFDGCNSCGREAPGAEGVCTQMACGSYAPGRCTEEFGGVRDLRGMVPPPAAMRIRALLNATSTVTTSPDVLRAVLKPLVRPLNVNATTAAAIRVQRAEDGPVASWYGDMVGMRVRDTMQVHLIPASTTLFTEAQPVVFGTADAGGTVLVSGTAASGTVSAVVVDAGMLAPRPGLFDTVRMLLFHFLR